MTTITVVFSRLWSRVCSCFGFRFDLSDIGLDDAELRQQLGYGRD